MNLSRPLVPLEEVAKRFGVSPSAVRAWMRKGLIPPHCYIQAGQTKRFRLEEVEKALTPSSQFKSEEVEKALTPSSQFKSNTKEEVKVEDKDWMFEDM
jgi:DNA-binding transcriptional MerR regulator